MPNAAEGALRQYTHHLLRGIARNEVFKRLHRGPATAGELLLGVIIGAAALIPVVYSFFAYQSLGGFKPPPDES